MFRFASLNGRIIWRDRCPAHGARSRTIGANCAVL
jgi:hypothetical protein